MTGKFLKLIEIIEWLLVILIMARIIVEIILSLSNRSYDRSNLILGFLYDFTEPMFKPFKRILPQSNLGLDISPIFAIAVIEISSKILKIIVYSLGNI